MLEKEFSEWTFENLKVKDITKDKYIRAIKTLSMDAEQWGFGHINLYTIEGIKYIDMIMQNESFVLKNKKGNNMYSSALKHYLTFLRQKKLL